MPKFTIDISLYERAGISGSSLADTDQGKIGPWRLKPTDDEIAKDALELVRRHGDAHSVSVQRMFQSAAQAEAMNLKRTEPKAG